MVAATGSSLSRTAMPVTDVLGPIWISTGVTSLESVLNINKPKRASLLRLQSDIASRINSDLLVVLQRDYKQVPANKRGDHRCRYSVCQTR